MFRRMISRVAILGTTLLIVALAYVQGYSDGDDGKPISFITSALAAEAPKCSISCYKSG